MLICLKLAQLLERQKAFSAVTMYVKKPHFFHAYAVPKTIYFYHKMKTDFYKVGTKILNVITSPATNKKRKKKKKQ